MWSWYTVKPRKLWALTPTFHSSATLVAKQKYVPSWSVIKIGKLTLSNLSTPKPGLQAEKQVKI